MALVTQPIALPVRRTLRLLAPLEWWHLLSLDAPTVAVLWAGSFARALHIALPADSLLLLFLGTWLLYVADRILDGLHMRWAQLRERHLFYIRHRAVMVFVAVPVTALVLWLVFFRMLPAARIADLIIFGVAAGYFALVHLRGAKIERWFPKELVVALVFATATAVPAWTRHVPHAGFGLPVFVLLVALFAALCWMNCIGIEKWEHGSVASFAQGIQIGDRTARWGHANFRRVSAGLAICAISAAAAFLCSGLILPAGLCFAAAGSAVLFMALDRGRLAAFHLRIAADAALLTPLLLLLIR